MKTFQEYLNEGKTLKSLSDQRIARDAHKWRQTIDKEKKKENKDNERLQKKLDKIAQKEHRKSTLSHLQEIKKSISDKQTFADNKQKLLTFIKDDKTKKFIEFVIESVNKYSSKDKTKSSLITKNKILVDRIIEHEFIVNNQDEDILGIIQRFMRIITPAFHNKQYNNIIAFYKAINNQIFNICKDLVFQIIEKEALNG